MSDLKELFGGNDPEIEAVQPEAEPEATPAPDVQPEAAPEPKAEAPQTPAQPEQPAQPPEGYVPIQTVHEARRKAKEWEERYAELQAQLHQWPVETPDALVDPEAFVALQQQTQAIVWQTKRDLSEAMARERFGDDTVDGALEWGVQLCAQNPGFNQQVLTAKDPIGFVVKEHKRQQALQALGDADPREIEAFRAWKAAQAQVQAQPVAAAPVAAAVSPQPVTAPPRSLASVTNAGDSSSAPKPDPVGSKLSQMF